MFKNPGTKWPILIGLSIIGVVGACVVTVKVAINNPVELSNYGMQEYHDYDAHANDIINAKIAFDAKYNIAYLTPNISEKGTVLEYRVSDKEGKPVNDAKVEVILTRPDIKELDIHLAESTVADGKYTFPSVDLPKAGRWDIMAKVTVGSDNRYFNIKADTRNSTTSEF